MKRNFLIFIGVIIPVIIVCSIIVPFLVPDTVIRFSNDTSARTNKEKTLASFKKIDSKNPFYAMKYYGDYDF
ncbi:MAG: hypothetical protein EU530_11660, partial [Promethearchaeota archaeon]